MWSDLEESKRFVMLSASSLPLNPEMIKSVLGRIHHDKGTGAGDWASEWMAEGDRLYQENKQMEAYLCYSLGRFPYVSSPVRQKCLDKCLLTFNEWVFDLEVPVEKTQVHDRNGSIPVYLSGFGDPQKPVLIVMGGIFSLKEQWSSLLLLGPKLGFSVIVVEGPGVGENPLICQPESHKMISSLLDQLATRANVSQAYLVGMGFGGLLGIRAAIADSRIQGITAIETPLHYFFHDQRHWTQVPRIIKQTLAHQCRLDECLLPEYLREFAISKQEIRRLRIPLHYIFNLRDEIIPFEEKMFLLNHALNLELIELDDVHGSPHHQGEIQKYIPLTLLRQQKSGRTFIKALSYASLQLEKLKRKLGSLSSIHSSRY
ncbi:alpha/beta fold hydrolase [Laceyella putida]|uniref:Alpha/beta fold hydrolase n=1 Tax=Laceyella putida TaxID=110101 RepID=A0ABW2RHJ7_9BACL